MEYDDLAAAVTAIVCEVTGVEPAVVVPQAELVALDVDSLSMVEVVIGIEQQLDARIPDEEVKALVTVGDLMAAVERALA